MTFKLLLSSTKHPSVQGTWVFVTMSRGQHKKKDTTSPSFLFTSFLASRSNYEEFELAGAVKTKTHWHKSTERESRVVRKGWGLQCYQQQHWQQQKQVMPYEEDSSSLHVHVIYLSTSSIISPLTYHFPGTPIETTPHMFMLASQDF